MIKATVDLVKQHLVKYPRILICVGSYTIGKERIFTAIANEIKAQIWGSTEKVRVLKTLSDPIIESNLTRTSCNAQIHVVEMHKVHSVQFRQVLLPISNFCRLDRLLDSQRAPNRDTCIVKLSKFRGPFPR